MEEPLIVSDPRIMVGKPVIRGTRITVEHILREIRGGMTIDDILEAHPHITREGVEAALRFAAKSVREERVYLLHRVSAGESLLMKKTKLPIRNRI